MGGGALVQLGSTYRPTLNLRGMGPNEMPDQPPQALKNEHQTNRDELRQRALDGFRNFKQKPDFRSTILDCPIKGLSAMDPNAWGLNRDYHVVKNNPRTAHGDKVIVRGTGGRVIQPQYMQRPADEAPLRLYTPGQNKQNFTRTTATRFDQMKAMHTGQVAFGNTSRRAWLKPHFEPPKNAKMDPSRTRLPQPGKNAVPSQGRGDTMPRQDYINRRMDNQMAGTKTTKVATHVHPNERNKKHNITFSID